MTPWCHAYELLHILKIQTDRSSIIKQLQDLSPSSITSWHNISRWEENYTKLQARYHESGPEKYLHLAHAAVTRKTSLAIKQNSSAAPWNPEFLKKAIGQLAYRTTSKLVKVYGSSKFLPVSQSAHRSVVQNQPFSFDSVAQYSKRYKTSVWPNYHPTLQRPKTRYPANHYYSGLHHGTVSTSSTGFPTPLPGTNITDTLPPGILSDRPFTRLLGPLNGDLS